MPRTKKTARQQSKMSSLITGIVVVVFFNALGAAQIRPYVGGSVGLGGSEDNPLYLKGTAGVNVNWRRLFVEAEGHADTANKHDTGDGYSFGGHGLLMLRVAPHWSFGGGLNYSELITSQYRKHGRWPLVAAMFEREWFRGNLQYLLPGSDKSYHLTGAVVDMRFRLGKGLYWRQRLSAYTFRNPFEAQPSYHTGSALDWGMLYVFADGER